LHRVRQLLGIYDNGGVLRARLSEEVRCVCSGRITQRCSCDDSHVSHMHRANQCDAELLRERETDSGWNWSAQKNNASLIIEQHSRSIIIPPRKVLGARLCSSFVIWVSRRKMIYDTLCGFIASYFCNSVCAWSAANENLIYFLLVLYLFLALLSKVLKSGSVVVLKHNWA
jgi:hypothetical protein